MNSDLAQAHNLEVGQSVDRNDQSLKHNMFMCSPNFFHSTVRYESK